MLFWGNPLTKIRTTMTSPEKPPWDLEKEIRKNQHTPKKKAQVETWLQEISTMLRKGYSQTAIYEALRNGKFIHCSYPYFSQILRAHQPADPPGDRPLSGLEPGPRIGHPPQELPSFHDPKQDKEMNPKEEMERLLGTRAAPPK